MKKVLAIAIATAACLMMAADVAVASVAPLGPGVIIGSWSQRFEGDVGVYDQVKITMNYGSILEEVVNYSACGWAQTSISSDAMQVIATGSGVANLRFDIHFKADMDVPLQFTYQAFLGGQEVDAAVATWGPDWTIEAEPGHGMMPVHRPVPEPVTMFSAFLAISGLGMYIRKRMKAPASA
jgi:hypothetical protein